MVRAGPWPGAAGVPRLNKSISHSAATRIGLSRYPIRQLTSGPAGRQAGSLKPGDASGHHHRTAICCARKDPEGTQSLGGPDQVCCSSAAASWQSPLLPPCLTSVAPHLTLLTCPGSFHPRDIHVLVTSRVHFQYEEERESAGCVGPDIRRTNLLGDSCRQCTIGMVCIFTCQYGDQCSLHCFFSSSRDPRDNGGSNGTRGDVTPGGSQSTLSHPPPGRPAIFLGRWTMSHNNSKIRPRNGGPDFDDMSALCHIQPTSPWSQEGCHRLVNRVCSCESLFACHTHGKLWGTWTMRGWLHSASWAYFLQAASWRCSVDVACECRHP